MKKSAFALAVILALGACSTDQAPAPMPVDHLLTPKLSLDVKTISLTDRFSVQNRENVVYRGNVVHQGNQLTPTMDNGIYADNRFSPTIDDAIKQWAGDRLQAVGQAGQAIVIIKDASLTSQPLPLKTGIDSWFTRQQALKYTGHAEVTVEANGSAGFATSTASATRSVTLPENPNALEKQDAYYSLLNGLMKDLGEHLDSGIQGHLQNFIITAPILGSTAIPMNAKPSYALPPASVAVPEAPVVFEQTTPVPVVQHNKPINIPLSGTGRQ